VIWGIIITLTDVEWTHRNRHLPKFFLCVVAAAIFVLPCSCLAEEKPLPAQSALPDIYRTFEARLEKNSFGFPLYLESSDEGGRMDVDVFGIFDHPFGSVAEVLKVPANWCDIALLHPNVKACTYKELSGSWRLSFYTGRKVYQQPSDAHRSDFLYRIAAQRGDYLDVVLSAPEGPFGTKDHRMRFEAFALDEGRTFVRVSYAYRHSFSGRLAASVYFAIFGRGRAGFTVTGTDSSGNPVYIGGQRGAMERNVVRYYFAIQSFMDAERRPEAGRFVTRINRWYDLTSRYRKQLFDLEKKEYLTLKTEEQKNQILMQRRITAHREP
jgi:hypothetical protein